MDTEGGAVVNGEPVGASVEARSDGQIAGGKSPITGVNPHDPLPPVGAYLTRFTPRGRLSHWPPGANGVRTLWKVVRSRRDGLPRLQLLLVAWVVWPETREVWRHPSLIRRLSAAGKTPGLSPHPAPAAALTPR